MSALSHVVVFAICNLKIAKLFGATQSVRRFTEPVLAERSCWQLDHRDTLTRSFWAVGFYASDAFSNFADSVYFSTVTYTTSGCDDIAPDPSMRILSSFTVIADVLTFGINITFLIRILPAVLCTQRFTSDRQAFIAWKHDAKRLCFPTKTRTAHKIEAG
ncbi:ion channel [Roseovarius aestuarii]|uniref:ion channel n=1 Tax=Roseovarius aestuarii TaxID=475083 RepID=UPI000A2719A6|nr:ion channel [Roseovarius aestuarii]